MKTSLFFKFPITCYSRALRSDEQNNFITELECLVIVDTLNKLPNLVKEC